MSGCQRKTWCRDFNSQLNEMNGKEEMEMKEEFIPQDIRPTHTPYTLVESEIEIKHEDVDFDNKASTQTHDSEANSELDLETVSRIQHVDSNIATVKAEEKDLKDFYLDILQCDRNSPQPIQDPLLIDPLHVDLHFCLPDQSAPSINIKREVDEGIVKMECSEEEEEKSVESGPDYNIENDLRSDPDYGPPPPMTQTQEVRHRQDQVSAKSFQESPSQSKTSKSEMEHMKTLQTHTMIHTGDKGFKCVHCEKSYKDKSSLVRHEKVHTGEKPPHLCDVCGKCFWGKSDLTRHLGIHTGEKRHRGNHTGEKPYKCKKCGKCFRDSCNLRKHEVIHIGPYKCDECQQSFFENITLTAHKRTHTGEKPFQCGVCDMSFSKMSDLSQHKKFHTRSLRPVSSTPK